MSGRRITLVITAIAASAWVMRLPGPIVSPVRADDVRAGLTHADRARLEKSGPVVVKEFVATLRKRFTEETAGDLRRFIDPQYLSEHHLQDGKFPVQTVVTSTIYDLQASDDPQTVVVAARTEAAAKEVFVFRLTVRDGKVFLQPLAAPDKTTNSFAPWILRLKP